MDRNTSELRVAVCIVENKINTNNLSNFFMYVTNLVYLEVCFLFS